MHSTESLRPADVERAWYVLDATDQVLGRVATRVATILRGKHKPSYTPHVDGGDNVIIINAGKITLTGNKREGRLESAASSSRRPTGATRATPAGSGR